MSVWIGKTLGKIQIEKAIGRGGMAEVYFGTHTALNRPVAVKFLHTYLEEQSDLSARFQREARVVAGLRHPNIVQVYDFDVADGQPYIVMEHIDGPSLSAYLRSIHDFGRRMPLDMVRRLFPLLAAALDYAHSRGLIHRDVKPGNVLLHSRTAQVEMGEALPADVEPMLADFGLVRVLDSPLQTSSGLITGTPAYMSPEQARGEMVDHRSDVYSLGVLLYEMLSGMLPFEGDTAMAILQKVIHEPPTPIPGLAREIQEVLDRALAKDPNQRYQSAGELSNAFLGALGFVTEAATLPPMVFPRPETMPSARNISPAAPDASRSRRSKWSLLALGGLAAVLVLLGVIFLKPFSAATNDPAATHPLVADPLFVGVLRFQDVAASLDGVTVKVSSMPPPPPETHYEIWLAGGENRRSLGVLSLDANGDGTVSFVDGQSRNLLDRYDRMEITAEPSPDPSPNSSGVVVYSSAIPGGALAHVRHLLVSMPDTPGQIGLIQGMRKDAALVDERANAMLAAFEAGDEAALRKSAEAVVNLIVGSQSPEYGDLDNDGVVTDPGDGYGLLLNGESPGYTGGALSHAQYAMQSGDAPESVLFHGEHVIISVTNVEGWAVQLRDLCLAILKNPLDEELRGQIVQAIGLADQIVHGVDLDGNERVDAVPGEGGVLTAHDHAYYMADMDILAGAGQVMPPGPPPETTPVPYNEK
jgi:serine/threonine-protein kinase